MRLASPIHGVFIVITNSSKTQDDCCHLQGQQRMANPIRRSLARRLGRNIGDRRRAVGLTQEQLAEYLEIDTLTVSRYETGTILPPLTVVDVVARLLNTTIADL